LIDDLKRRGVRTKVQRMRDGSTRGGTSFVKGRLYHLLKNRIYIGQIVHHDKVYPGEHEPIVAREVFDQVQTLLANNAALRASGASSSHPSLLAGMIRDAEDRPMSPSHTCNGGRRYRYYVSNVAVPGDQNSPSVRIPAAELKRALGAMHQLAQHMRDELVFSCRALLRKLDLQLTIDGQGITASCSVTRLAREIGLAFGRQDERLPVPISTRISVRGRELMLVIMPLGARPPKHNRHLIDLIVQAHHARDELMEMGAATSDAERRRDLTRLAKYSYLAPDIISAILDGRQPDDLGARKLRRITELPRSWKEQRKVLGFA
jgi:site-specific DNA recombinase